LINSLVVKFGSKIFLFKNTEKLFSNILKFFLIYFVIKFN